LKNPGGWRNRNLQVAAIDPAHSHGKKPFDIDASRLVIAISDENAFARIHLKWIELLSPPLDR
jgi:hypothetical protein